MDKNNNIVIEAKSLCLKIKESEILKSVNFHVAEGEIYALLGGNGAVKWRTCLSLQRYTRI